MKDLFIWFWSAMILLSIAWYAILIFYVGIKGGREIVQMAHNLKAQTAKQESHSSDSARTDQGSRL